MGWLHCGDSCVFWCNESGTIRRRSKIQLLQRSTNLFAHQIIIVHERCRFSNGVDLCHYMEPVAPWKTPSTLPETVHVFDDFTCVALNFHAGLAASCSPCTVLARSRSVGGGCLWPEEVRLFREERPLRQGALPCMECAEVHHQRKGRRPLAHDSAWSTSAV